MNATLVVILLLLANVIFSAIGFRNKNFFYKYQFVVEKVLLQRQYWRVLTAGFLHVGWGHLAVNMLTFYFFGVDMVYAISAWQLFLIYFASLIGGQLFALFIHRHHADYSAVGASGAVAGVVFATIAYMPDMYVNILGIIPLPGWLYAIMYIFISIYGIRSKSDNIGHEAHLAGALTGMLLMIAMYPAILRAHYLSIAAILLPCIFFIYIVLTRPYILLIRNNFFQKHQPYLSIDDKYRMERAHREKQVDAILEKIQRKGMISLTSEERKTLEEYSNKL
ncbi:Membrane associated serine protease, rhomboid family [Chitinophaga jiangningensis]|uniref:Membrane associated serine protease, rhomboid family n=1 Tax=Chitinophaga jiangningensis TaxID=1419482 RepID=A0A1M6VRK6_9BACT|nr:rhomboid family intramembrane serine protease [Chitinophaga jiangningensis]SHK83975.1 Membrane associated serine protease, rhomboid family [Chitinophaga jiangningensis]